MIAALIVCTMLISVKSSDSGGTGGVQNCPVTKDAVEDFGTDLSDRTSLVQKVMTIKQHRSKNKYIKDRSKTWDQCPCSVCARYDSRFFGVESGDRFECIYQTTQKEQVMVKLISQGYAVGRDVGESDTLKAAGFTGWSYAIISFPNTMSDADVQQAISEMDQGGSNKAKVLAQKAQEIQIIIESNGNGVIGNCNVEQLKDMYLELGHCLRQRDTYFSPKSIQIDFAGVVVRRGRTFLQEGIKNGATVVVSGVLTQDMIRQVWDELLALIEVVGPPHMHTHHIIPIHHHDMEWVTSRRDITWVLYVAKCFCRDEAYLYLGTSRRVREVPENVVGVIRDVLRLYDLAQKAGIQWDTRYYDTRHTVDNMATCRAYIEQS